VNEKAKRSLKQILGLTLCVSMTFGTIHLFEYISSIPKEEKLNESSVAITEEIFMPGLDTENGGSDILSESGEYDPVSDLIPNNSVSYTPAPKQDYTEEIGKYPLAADLKKEKYTLDSDDYDPSADKVALVKSSSQFESELSLKEYTVQKIVRENAPKGGYNYKAEDEKADCPLLRPYYGFIIYTTSKSVKLLDSEGNVLIKDLKGYEPVYRTTLAGDPLFKKENKYYFYADKKIEDSGALFFDEVEANDFEKLPAQEPTAYKYFKYNYYIITTKYYNQEDKREILMTDISVSTPKEPMMVEYLVNEKTLNTLTLPDMSNINSHKLYPFCSYEYDNDFKITKILWGYMDEQGNEAIAPQFFAAYSFNEEGYAVVVDVNNHVCIIDTKGKVVYNPYNEPIYLEEMAGGYARDIFYKPDTYGIESTGMFYIDNGFVRMRRRLVDTTQGSTMENYAVKNETQAVIAPDGTQVAYPADYELVAYSDGILLLKKGIKYGYMTTDGIWLIEPVLRIAKPFSEGLAVISYDNEKLGVIDTEGNTVLAFIYSHIESCSGGVITAYEKEQGWTIYNKLSKDADNKDVKNPVLTLKHRALAQAKYDYYKSQEKETQATIQGDRR